MLFGEIKKHINLINNLFPDIALPCSIISESANCQEVIACFDDLLLTKLFAAIVNTMHAQTACAPSLQEWATTIRTVLRSKELTGLEEIIFNEACKRLNTHKRQAAEEIVPYTQKKRRRETLEMQTCEPASFLVTLPKELLVRILLDLARQDYYNAVQACKDFLATRSQYLEKHSDLTLVLSKKKPLNISAIEDTNLHLVNQLKKAASRITSIDLSRTTITNEDLVTILKTYSNLEALALASSAALTGRGIAQALQYAPQLQILCLDGRFLSDELLNAILEKIPNLKELSINQSIFLKLNPISGKGLSQALQHVPHLEALWLFGGIGEIVDKDLEIALQCIPHLRRLSLHGGDSQLTDKGLEALQHVPQLEQLMLYGLTNITQFEFLKHVPNLLRFDLALASTSALNELRYTPKLQELYLPCSNSIKNGNLEMLRHVPELQELHISGCGPMRNEDVKYLRSLKYLQSLNCNYSKISGKQLLEIVSDLKYLKNLNVTSCKNVHNDHIQQLQRSYPTLNLTYDHENIRGFQT